MFLWLSGRALNWATGTKATGTVVLQTRKKDIRVWTNAASTVKHAGISCLCLYEAAKTIEVDADKAEWDNKESLKKNMLKHVRKIITMIGSVWFTYQGY